MPSSILLSVAILMKDDGGQVPCSVNVCHRHHLLHLPSVAIRADTSRLVLFLNSFFVIYSINTQMHIFTIAGLDIDTRFFIYLFFYIFRHVVLTEEGC